MHTRLHSFYLKQGLVTPTHTPIKSFEPEPEPEIKKKGKININEISDDDDDDLFDEIIDNKPSINKFRKLLKQYIEDKKD